MGEEPILEDRIPLFIEINQVRERPRLAGIPIPFASYIVTNASADFVGGDGHGLGNASHSVYTLAGLLINLELNIPKKSVGPINVRFVNILDNGYLGMEKLLEMYARSMGTTVTFERK